jgi:hypothetical protein
MCFGDQPLTVWSPHCGPFGSLDSNLSSGWAWLIWPSLAAVSESQEKRWWRWLHSRNHLPRWYCWSILCWYELRWRMMIKNSQSNKKRIYNDKLMRARGEIGGGEGAERREQRVCWARGIMPRKVACWPAWAHSTQRGCGLPPPAGGMFTNNEQCAREQTLTKLLK